MHSVYSLENSRYLFTVGLAYFCANSSILEKAFVMREYMILEHDFSFENIQIIRKNAKAFIAS